MAPGGSYSESELQIKLILCLLIQHDDDTSVCTLEKEMAKYQAGQEGVCLSDLNRWKCWATIRTFLSLSPHASVNVILFLFPSSPFSSLFLCPCLPYVFPSCPVSIYLSLSSIFCFHLITPLLLIFLQIFPPFLNFLPLSVDIQGHIEQ